MWEWKVKYKQRENEVINQTLSCFPCLEKPVEHLRNEQKEQDVRRKGGASYPDKGKSRICVSVNLLVVVGIGTQMLELIQYALVHHVGKSLVPTTRN